MGDMPDKKINPRVGLFVTCLVNAMRPSVGFAAVDLLERAGCKVEIPREQTCCGLPGYNAGDLRDCERIARQVISTFESYDYVVVPSGSCAAMIAHNYHEHVFENEGVWRRRAEALGKKTFELTGFLVDVLGFTLTGIPHDMGELKATYHDSCSCLRRMKVKSQPRKLLRDFCRIEIREMKQTEECCGFGGSFSLKMPEIAARLGDEKIKRAVSTGADMLIGGDLGCLLHLESRIKAQGKSMKVMHVAEVLTGRAKVPSAEK